LDKVAFIRACREGGAVLEHAIASLDRELFAALYRECRRVVRDADLARDTVQDTFIKVWQRCATFKGDAELATWIRSILRHSILDAFRRARSHASLDDPSVEVEARIAELSAATVPTPQAEAHAAEMAATFRRCWERFEADCPAQAAVIRWIGEDGLDNAELSAMLERTPGATREYVSQCRKKVRVYLAEWYELGFGGPAS